MTLSLAVLAGIGLAGWARTATDGRNMGRLGLVAVLVAALLAEQITVPVPLVTPNAPPFYEQLGRSSETGAVMEWPFCKQCAATNYYQTVHHHPAHRRYIARRLGYPIRKLPPYLEIAPADDDIFARDAITAVGRWALHYSGVRWIVVYLDDPELNEGTTAQMLARYAEPTPIHADDRTAVYRPLPPGGAGTYLAAETGWTTRSPGYRVEGRNVGLGSMRR